LAIARTACAIASSLVNDWRELLDYSNPIARI
jgi:hypothetical protein